MISADFASNEQWDDSRKAFQVMLNPFSWRKGKNIDRVRNTIKRNFFPSSSIYIFLSGRGALYYLLKSLKVPERSEILVQGFTCEAVVLPILELNHIPVYIDINEEDFSMNMEDLEKKITPRSKILILQHTFGITPQKRSEIIALARQKKITVIEDLAHGFNPKIFDKDKYKTVKLLSFGRSKAFSSVFGGAVVTDEKILSTKLRGIEDQLSFPNFGFILKTLFYKCVTPFIKATYDIYIGKLFHKTIELLGLFSHEISEKEKSGKFDHRMALVYPNGLATVLLHQLRKYKKVATLRSKNVQKYSETFHKNFSENSLIRFPLLVENRTQIVKNLRKQNIFLGKWYDQVIAPKSLNIHKFQYKKGTCPRAEEICEKVINLPTSITPHQADIVIKALQKELEKNHS